MRTNAHVSLLGNLAKDPMLKQVGNRNVCNFTVAVTTGTKTEEGNSVANFYECSVWGRYGETMFSMLQKGTEVLVHGMLEDVTIKNETGDFHQLRVDVDNVVPLRNLRNTRPAATEPAEEPVETKDDTE